MGGVTFEIIEETTRRGRPVYVRPLSIEDAVKHLAAAPRRVMAGGTDIYPAHVGKPMPAAVIDVTAIDALRAISDDGANLRIGAAVTWSRIAAAELPPALDGLKAAAREVGSIQIQNRATIAGNLCNASPAADGVPPLLTLDAAVELVSARGTRVLPLQTFITGYRQTALAPDELVTAVLVPKPAPRAASAFAKLGARRYLVISIVMAAAVIERGKDGLIAHAAVAIGAASPVARRLPALEQALCGLDATTPPSAVLQPSHLGELAPIDDIRATAHYRSDAALALVADVIDRAAGVPST
jgi:CO/xanthine dehydrogenase FAD-binding subunit